MIAGIRFSAWAILVLASTAIAQDTIDVAFKGGSAGDYVDAVRAAAGEVNILIHPEAAQVEMAPVTLKRVLPETALELLKGRRGQIDGTMVRLDINRFGGGGQSLPIYRVDADEVGRDPLAGSEESAVWSLREALESGLKAEDALTALETALELLGDRYPEAKVRFHAETQLLLARAHPAQIHAIQEVIKELIRSRQPSEHEKEMMDLKSRFDREMMIREREIVDASDEAARARQERDEMRQRLIDTVQNLEHKGAEVQELNQRIAQLERQLNDRSTQP